MKEELCGIDEVPDGEAEGEEGEGDVEEAPVADDVAVKLFALHGTLDVLQFGDLFLGSGHEGAWAGERTVLIGDESRLTNDAAQFLWSCFEGDVC